MTVALARAVHDGVKTDARRPIKDPDELTRFLDPWPQQVVLSALCEYGGVGDRLMVRHPVMRFCRQGEVVSGINEQCWNPVTHDVIWRSGEIIANVLGIDEANWTHVPASAMPKWAGRTWLELTEVKAERLHDSWVWVLAFTRVTCVHP